MDWKPYLTHQSTTLDTFRKAHPEAAKGFTALHHGTLAEGALMGGGPAFMYGAKALEAWDQLTRPAAATRPAEA